MTAAVKIKPILSWLPNGALNANTRENGFICGGFLGAGFLGENLFGSAFSIGRLLGKAVSPLAAEDDALMGKIAGGDHKSFEQLFDRYSSVVLGYCNRMLANKEQAEEVSQEVWIKLVKTASSYKSEGKFKSWLLTMTRNTCLNVLRKPRMEILVGDEGLSSEADERESVEQVLIQADDVNHVKKAIDALPDNQRTCLVMWMTEELSYADLATQLGMKLPAVKSLLFRAKQNLELKVKEGAV